jgi:hypothetical protein
MVVLNLKRNYLGMPVQFSSPQSGGKTKEKGKT